MTTKHPMQPVVSCPSGHRSIVRFKENKIVSYLLDNGGIDMNKLARLDFSQEDRSQFAQLIGYSVDGWSTLSYASDSEVEEAYKRVEEFNGKV